MSHSYVHKILGEDPPKPYIMCASPEIVQQCSNNARLTCGSCIREGQGRCLFYLALTSSLEAFLFVAGVVGLKFLVVLLGDRVPELKLHMNPFPLCPVLSLLLHMCNSYHI